MLLVYYLAGEGSIHLLRVAQALHTFEYVKPDAQFLCSIPTRIRPGIYSRETLSTSDTKFRRQTNLLPFLVGAAALLVGAVLPVGAGGDFRASCFRASCV